MVLQNRKVLHHRQETMGAILTPFCHHSDSQLNASINPLNTSIESLMQGSSNYQPVTPGTLPKMFRDLGAMAQQCALFLPFPQSLTRARTSPSPLRLQESKRPFPAHVYYYYHYF